MGARMAENISYYIFTIVITTYVTTSSTLDKSFALNAVLIGAAIHFVAIPIVGRAVRPDRPPAGVPGRRRRRRRVGVRLLRPARHEELALAVLGVIVGLVLHGAMYAPQAAFFSELFGTSVRYSGASVGYQLASIFAGGLAPIIAVKLLKGVRHRQRDRRLRRIWRVISVVAVASYPETRKPGPRHRPKAILLTDQVDRPRARSTARQMAGLRISAMPTEDAPGACWAPTPRVDRRIRGEADRHARLALRIRAAIDTRRRGRPS